MRELHCNNQVMYKVTQTYLIRTLIQILLLWDRDGEQKLTLVFQRHEIKIHQDKYCNFFNQVEFFQINKKVFMAILKNKTYLDEHLFTMVTTTVKVWLLMSSHCHI